MNSNSTYTVLPDDSDSASNLFANMYDLFRSSDKKKRNGKKKKTKKGKKKLHKKFEKYLANMLGECKTSKKSKKSKKSKRSPKKMSKRELKYRLIEKSTNTVLDTTSYAIKRYVDSKFCPAEVKAKDAYVVSVQ